jgi:ATP-dependent RNA helicase DDX47/RRP3
VTISQGSEAEVLLLLERVSEAARIAQMEMRDMEANAKGRKHFDGLEDEDEEGGQKHKGRGGRGDRRGGRGGGRGRRH